MEENNVLEEQTFNSEENDVLDVLEQDETVDEDAALVESYNDGFEKGYDNGYENGVADSKESLAIKVVKGGICIGIGFGAKKAYDVLKPKCKKLFNKVFKRNKKSNVNEEEE